MKAEEGKSPHTGKSAQDGKSAQAEKSVQVGKSGEVQKSRSIYELRTMQPEDYAQVIALTQKVYPFVDPYVNKQLESQRNIFPEGQFVVVEKKTQKIAGYAASLIVDYDEYPKSAKWWDLTDWGMFTNHDAKLGRTLYGAEVMVDPDTRGQGIGKILYAAREALTRKFDLVRIRAGARLRDYHKHADKLEPEEYVRRVIAGKLSDRTLTFQLKRGFHVLGVSKEYLFSDPESLNYAAIIEWINPDAAKQEDYDEWKNSPFYVTK